MLDHLIDNLGRYLLGLIILLLGIGYFAIKEDMKREQAFMVECEKYEPHYKCLVKWRAGESNTAVVPVPIIIHH